MPYEPGSPESTNIQKKFTSSHSMNASNDCEIKACAPEPAGTVFTGYTVMTKSLLGSGVLSIAFACAKCGLICGIAMLFLAAALTWISLHVFSVLCMEFPSNNITFYSLTERIIPRARWVLDVAVVIDCGGSAICFLQVIGSLMATGYREVFDSTASQSTVVMIVQCVAVLLLLPLCLMHDISDLKIVNIVGLLSMVYVVILAVVYTDASHFTSDLLYPESVMQAVSAFPIMIFAFSCQQNILSVASEMYRPTVRKLDLVTLTAIGSGLLLYLPVMVLPFITFGRSNPAAHTFFALLPKSVPVQIGYCFAALAISISFILVIHPIRRSILSLMYGNDFPVGKKEVQTRVAIVSTTVAVLLGVAVLAGEKLGPTLEFTGLLGANTCGFVMPFILYLVHFRGSKKSLFSVVVVAMLVLCLALYPIGITATILGILES